MATCPLTREEILDMILANLPEDKHIVSAASNNSGTTLTRNDGVTFNIPVLQGDLLETPDEFIITFNGETITIPKCLNHFYDCNNESIDNCRDRIVTCENLDDRNYITHVLTEDVISGDGRPANPVRFNCAAAELIDNPDNHQVLLCGPNGVKKIDPNDLLSEICFDNVPDLGDVCGNTEQLVLYNDGGCMKLARVNKTSLNVALGGYFAVSGGKPINTSGYILPDDFPTPNLYYTVADLVADGGTDPSDRTGVDDAKILNSRVAAATFDNPCPTVFTLNFMASFVPEASAEDAYSKAANLGARYRVDGGAWFYLTTPGLGSIAVFGSQRAIEGQYEIISNIALPAGQVELEFFYLANVEYNAVTPVHARWAANTNEPGYAVPAPRFTLTRAF